MKDLRTSLTDSLTRTQLLILAALALADVLIIALMGGVILVQTLRAPGTPQQVVVVAGVTATPPPTRTRPPTRTPPPTWTPRVTPTTEPGLPVFEETTCFFSEPNGVEVTCGHLNVPEDRTGLLTDTIELAVAVYHSVHPDPAPDPVVFLQGGPGSGAIDIMPHVYPTFVLPLLRERDVIVFDQRGTGLSQPSLDCPEYSQALQRELRQGYFFESEGGSTDRYVDALLQCRDRLTGSGVNLAAYTSAASAADIHDLTEALGYEQVNLYGVSYGTRLAQTVMRDYPEIVRSAVLDAALPLEVHIYNEQAAKTDYVLNKLFEGCAADADCRATYPNLEQVYNDVVAQLNAEPVEVWGITMNNGRTFHATIDGVEMTSAIFFAMYVTDYIPYTPQMIFDVRDGRYDLLRSFLSAPLYFEDSIHMGMMLSVNCHEEVFATTPEELDADLARFPGTEAFARAVLFGSAERHFEFCRAWGAAPFDPVEVEPVVSDIPALVLVGEYDPATPPDFGRQVAANLNNSYFFEFPGLGHGCAVDGPGCPLDIALAFLDDPYSAPDSTCIQEMDGPDFRGYY